MLIKAKAATRPAASAPNSRFLAKSLDFTAVVAFEILLKADTKNPPVPTAGS